MITISCLKTISVISCDIYCPHLLSIPSYYLSFHEAHRHNTVFLQCWSDQITFGFAILLFFIVYSRSFWRILQRDATVFFGILSSSVLKNTLGSLLKVEIPGLCFRPTCLRISGMQPGNKYFF